MTTAVKVTPLDSEAAREPDHPRERALPRTPLRLVLRIVLLVLAAGLVVTSIYATTQWREERQQAEDLRDARNAALIAARTNAETIASYDYRELDAYFDAVGDIATGEFAKQYADANENFRSTLRKTKSVVTAEVINAGVESLTTDEAVVVLFVDQTVDNVATDGTATDRNRMLMTLERDGDAWLVSDLALR